MSIVIIADPPELFFHIHEIVRLFFPGEELERQGFTLPALRLWRHDREDTVEFVARFNDRRGEFNWRRQYRVPGGGENDARRLARIFVFQMLSVINGAVSAPYGILTGIRPTKLVQRMLDEGQGREQVLAALGSDYLLDAERATLLWEIANRERPFLHGREEAASRVSVYIGVPYCPTRCYYCSFPSTRLTCPEQELGQFMAAIVREMAGVGPVVRELGLQVENIYLGGGTPSLLGAPGVDRLLAALEEHFPLTTEREISMEAGRPDTIDRPLMELLAARGVDRLCINPQSMNDPTLERIGRCHNSRQVEEAVAMAREAGINTVNMDVIIGLPGEGEAEWQHTLGRILELKPENITVHTLASKKGSRMAEEQGLGCRDREVAIGVGMFHQGLTGHGYAPYYLYRQKNMRDNLENIGYALPGHICRYNIQIIEERQTIIGLGGGAASKFVNPADWTLTSFYNPKNPEVYCESIPRLVAGKVDKLRRLNIESS